MEAFRGAGSTSGRGWSRKIPPAPRNPAWRGRTGLSPGPGWGRGVSIPPAGPYPGWKWRRTPPEPPVSSQPSPRGVTQSENGGAGLPHVAIGGVS